MVDSSRSTHLPGDRPALHAGDSGVLHQAFDAGGRLHIDRPLPFLALNRYPVATFSLAQRIAAICPSSMIWPAQAAADAEAHAALLDILRQRPDALPQFLLVELPDLELDTTLDNESPRLEQFRFVVAASTVRTRRRPRQSDVALADLYVEQREPNIEHASGGSGFNGIEPLLDIAKVCHGSAWDPQIHRVPGENGLIRKIFHTTRKRRDRSPHALQCSRPSSGQRLPASRFTTANSVADASSTPLACRSGAGAHQSFVRLLLSISPINTTQAFEHFTPANAIRAGFSLSATDGQSGLIKRDLMRWISQRRGSRCWKPCFAESSARSTSN